MWDGPGPASPAGRGEGGRPVGKEGISDFVVLIAGLRDH
jgi:hypothetical protein